MKCVELSNHPSHRRNNDAGGAQHPPHEGTPHTLRTRADPQRGGVRGRRAGGAEGPGRVGGGRWGPGEEGLVLRATQAVRAADRFEDSAHRAGTG